jgi:hypothetical protein
MGEDAKPIQVRMDLSVDCKAHWTVKDAEKGKEERALELMGEGMSIRDVAEEVGLSKSKVHRLKALVVLFPRS